MSVAEARELDRADPLAPIRARFAIPRDGAGRDLVYFCGNSLGLQPTAAADAVDREMRVWRELAVAGHFRGPQPWVRYEEPLRENMAQLIGAHADEVAIMNALTVNLHLLLASFYRPSGRRTKIVIEAHAFPSDRYAVAGQARWHGLDPDETIVELAAERGTPEEALEELLSTRGDEVALVLLPGIQYATGTRYDEFEVVNAARRAGCMVGLDLAHAAGNVPVRLHESQCDFAVWCTYKYLCGGPGSTGGAFVHRRHHGSDVVRLAGWFGNAESTRFEMRAQQDPAAGAGAWVVSNPAVLSTAPLAASLAIFAEVGMEKIREKSVRLTGFLESLINQELGESVRIVTPDEPRRRGAQLSLQVRGGRDQGRRVFAALENAGVIGDWREPDFIRLAPSPLYNTYSECVRCVEAMQQAL